MSSIGICLIFFLSSFLFFFPCDWTGDMGLEKTTQVILSHHIKDTMINSGLDHLVEVVLSVLPTVKLLFSSAFL